VIIKTSSKEIVIDSPEVTLTQLQGQRIYQVAGGTLRDRKSEMEPEIIEEDVQLVAQKANVDADDAREALKSTKGDLAQAILLLAQRRIGSK
jgi:nascent polypeptide-associated complex subunit alpha